MHVGLRASSKVRLRAGRSVELDHKRVGSWKHDNP